jgi:hypothetical protein
MRKKRFLDILSSVFIALFSMLITFLIVGLIYENTGQNWLTTTISLGVIIITVGGFWGIIYKM